MKRSLRILLNLAAVLSALLFLAFLALWGTEGHLLLYRDWPRMPRWDFLGFRTIEVKEYGVGWIIPCWFLCTATALLPGLRIASYIRRRWPAQAAGSRRLNQFRQILLNAATVVSLALFVAVLALCDSRWGMTVVFAWPAGNAVSGDFLVRTPLRATFDHSASFLLLIFIALPTARVIRFAWDRSRASRRTRLALCPHCGYDLRATPDRCPECGAVPKAVQA